MRFFIILIFITSISNQITAQSFDLNTTEQISLSEADAFKKGLKSFSINTMYQEHFDVTKQKLDLIVKPGVHFIEGKVETTFIVTKLGYSIVSLNCSDSLKINSVLIDNNSTEYAHIDGELRVIHSTEFKLNSKHKLSISYSGIPPKSRAFTADTNAYGDSVLWTLSEPYGAKDWWPCKQDLRDKIDTLEINVTVPQKYTVAANGLLHSVVPVGANQLTYKWKHNYPIATYLVAFSAANYIVVNEDLELINGPLKFVNYIYPQDSAEAIQDLKTFKNTINLFEELFGPYPFRKEQYGHAQFGWGGGMEHQTMSFMVHFKHGLVAHELAHQWFGDKITCGTWQELWLNEGFATYLEGLTYNFLFPENNWENWKTITLDLITSSPDGSVFIPDTNNIDRMFSSRLTYRKGAYLLHMLRFKMGDELFFKSIRDYLNDTKTSYGFVENHNLIEHLKANGGYKIDEFFNDWYKSQGFPSYTLEWHQTSLGKLHLLLSQTQSYIWEGVFFDMEVPIRIIDDYGDSTIVIDNYTDDQELVIDWDANRKVRVVLIDPERWVLKGENKVVKSIYEPKKVAYKIAPNPVQNELKLMLSSPTLPSLELEIFDITGNLILAQKQITGLSSKIIRIDTELLDNGIYTLRVKDYWGVNSLKFIKMD